MSDIRKEAPFARTDGEAWSKMLLEHPERAKECDWTSLAGEGAAFRGR